MKKRFQFLSVVLLSLVFSGGAGIAASDLRNLDEPFVISPDEPFYMALVSEDCYRPLHPEIWDIYPESLKKRMCVELCNKASIEQKLELLTSKNIPVIYRVRSVWPVEQTPPMEPEFIETILQNFPVVRGLALSELMNARFTQEEREYVLTILSLCEKYNKIFLWTEASGGALPFMEIGSDSELREALARNSDRVVLINEAVDGTLQPLSLSVLLGLDQSGVIRNWGMNPQFYYWRNSGFMKLGQQVGPRQGIREDMPPAVYSQLMMVAAMNGGTSFFFGAEKAPHYLDENFKPTEAWHATLPFIEELLKGGVIPSREEVADTINLAVQGGMSEIAQVSTNAAHTGLRSLVISAALRHTAWYQESWTPIKKDGSYVLEGWLKAGLAIDGMRPQVEVIYFNRNTKDWPFVGKELKELTSPRDWTRFEMPLNPPGEATDFVVAVSVEGSGGTVGAYYFDDIAVQDSAGDNLIDTGSFEEIYEASGHPVGWAVGFKKSEAHTADFGYPGKFLSKVFDLYGHGDMFLETGRWGPVPILPESWSPVSTETLASKYVSLDLWNEEQVTAKLSTVVYDGCEGMRAQYPGRVWLSSSLENVPGVQKAFGTAGAYKVTAWLNSESHLLAVDRPESLSMNLLVSGRAENITKVLVEGPEPFTADDCCWTYVAKPSGSGYSLLLEIDHKKLITHQVVIRKK